jgi:hypothetical protein
VQDFDATDRVERTRPRWGANEKFVTYDGKSIPFQEAYTADRVRQLRLYRSYESPLHAFRNQRNLRFEETTHTWGLTNAAIRHGIALADLDNDGELDLVVNPLNSPAELWINQSSAPRLAVELRGRPPNTDAIGAKITLSNGAVPRQTHEIAGGGIYLSSSHRRAVFAAGVPNSQMRLEVAWRSGLRTVVNDVRPNFLYRIDEQ